MGIKRRVLDLIVADTAKATQRNAIVFACGDVIPQGFLIATATVEDVREAFWIH